jgi:hypothetical protein
LGTLVYIGSLTSTVTLARLLHFGLVSDYVVKHTKWDR